MRTIIRWSSILAGLLLSASCFASIAPPHAVVEATAKQVMTKLKAHHAELKSKPNLVYNIIKTAVLPQVDVTAMSRSVITPEVWNQASKTQQTAFTHAFTKLVVRTYASGLANYTNEEVKFYPVVGGYADKTRVKVQSQIFRRGGPSIAMNYRLIRRDNSWKVYDVTVEGISLLHSFRSQFASQLRTANFAQLIKELEQHNQKQNG